MQPGHLDGYPGVNSQGPIPTRPSPVSAWLKVNVQTQSVHIQLREYGCCQRGDHGLIQYLPYHGFVKGVLWSIPAAAGASQPVAPHTYNSVPLVRLPVDADQNLHRTRVLIGKSLHAVPPPRLLAPPCLPAPPRVPSPPRLLAPPCLPAPPRVPSPPRLLAPPCLPAPPRVPSPPRLPAPPHDAAPPQPSSSNPGQQEDDHPYVKRPPNSFMIFMKEQRPHVEEKIRRMGNRIVNTVLGQRWNSLSEEEQVIYKQQAQLEKQLHAQRHPGWSVSENYGKKRKRDQRRLPKASMKQHASQVASTSQAAVEPYPMKSVMVLTDVTKCHVGTQTDSSDLPACGVCHCLQV